MNRFGAQLSVLWAHIFIVLAGLAALPNSVWSVSIITQGNEPPFGLSWLGWAFSGLLLGLTIDVGQIVISIQIARGDGTKMRLVAFGLLGVLIFYLQWYHSAAHVGLTPFALGMASQVSSETLSLRDYGVWILSVSMPVITILYTFGHPTRTKPEQTATITQTERTTTVKVERSDQPRISPANVPQLEAHVYSAMCDECNYTATKTTQARADAAVRFHKRAKHKVEVE